MLIKYLPADSEFRGKADPDSARIATWSATDYLLADLFDITAKAHFRGPTPYPRPADAIKTERERLARHAALAEQAERNRLREEAEALTD